MWPEEFCSASHSRAFTMLLKTMTTRREELEVGFRIFRKPMERRTGAGFMNFVKLVESVCKLYES